MSDTPTYDALVERYAAHVPVDEPEEELPLYCRVDEFFGGFFSDVLKFFCGDRNAANN